MGWRTIDQGLVLKAALTGGLIAGLVDVGAASIINRTSPRVILQAIASGILGMSAYKLSWTVLFGLVLQVVMSILIAAIYSEAAAAMPSLRRHPYQSGLAYGVVVFLVMNFVVVPLSAAAPKPAHVTVAWLLMNVGAMLLFGVLVSLAANRILADRS